MQSGEPMEGKLRISGMLVVCGLLIEALCLVWSRPIAFVVLACIGGALIGLGVLFFLYSLVSSVPHAVGTAKDEHGG